MSVREELAAAANTVAGVNVQPYYVQGGKALSGNVTLTRVEYPNPFGGIAYWEVIVVLAQDIPTAQKQAEDLLPRLYDAFDGVLAVDSASFGTTSQDNRSGQPCLVIARHRAMEKRKAGPLGTRLLKLEIG
ncbi:hypothetical protein, partial [Streptomyces sp. NPDC003952]